MKNLLHLQEAFKHYLFFADKSIAAQILSTENLNSVNRLAIYGNAYHSRLIEVLIKDFPALNYFMGEEEFRVLCHAYIKAHPSTYYSLRWFGKDLAHFLDSHNDYGKRQILTELASFEWSFVDAFDAMDAKISQVADVAKIIPEAWPTLRVTLHPSVQWVSCSWNCLMIWQSMKNNTLVPAPSSLDFNVDYLIWRQGLNVRYRSLDKDEAAVLLAIFDGADFAEICTVLTQWLNAEETALRAASLFKTWLADGLISRLIY